MILALLAVVTALYNPPTYACDGSTAVYTVNFQYIANTDVILTSTTAAGIVTTLTQGTDFTLSVSSTSSSATATLANPASKCPSGSQLKIRRNTSKTQPYSFRSQTSFNPALHELAYDREMLILQENAAGVAASGDISTSSVLITGTTTAVNLGDLLSVVPIPAKAFGVNCDGTDEHLRIQQCTTTATQCVLPPSTISSPCFTGGTTIVVPTGHRLLGNGTRSTILKYNGTGCAMSFDNNDAGGADRLEIFNSNTGAASQNLCITNAVGPTLRLSFNDVFLLGAQSPPIAGANCLFMNSTTTNSLYYILFTHLITQNCDRGAELLGASGQGGVNANWWVGYSGNANVTNWYADGKASDNYVQGHCNAGGTVFAQRCFNVSGTDASNKAAGNEIHLVTDQGAGNGGFVVNSFTASNWIQEFNEGSAADSMSGDSTNFLFDTQLVSSRNVWLPSLLLSGTSGLGGSPSASMFLSGAVRATDQTHLANTGSTISSTMLFVGHNSTSGALTDALGAFSGQLLFFYDEDASMSAVKTLTLTAPAGGTVNGAASKVIINAASGSALCYASSVDGKTWLCITH